MGRFVHIKINIGEVNELCQYVKGVEKRQKWENRDCAKSARKCRSARGRNLKLGMMTTEVRIKGMRHNVEISGSPWRSAGVTGYKDFLCIACIVVIAV